MYNRVLLDIRLPTALYCKLLGQEVGLGELEEMEPTVGRSLRQLMEYRGQAGAFEVRGAASCQRNVFWWQWRHARTYQASR